MNQLLAILLFTATVLTGVNHADERPNIVLILCDDLGCADDGFSDSPDIKRPQFDQLAHGGVFARKPIMASAFFQLRKLWQPCRGELSFTVG